MVKNKKWINGQFLDQNHGLTPLEKSLFFDILNLFFYFLERRFLAQGYHKRHFSGQYCIKIKKMEKGSILDKNHGLTPIKKSEFFDFLNMFFLKVRKAFFS